MNRQLTMLAACTIAFAPAGLSAQTAPGNGQFNGNNWDHLNGPAVGSTGQRGASCEDLGGTTPGNSADARGGGSPFGGEDSTAGSHYAGSQLQNQRNNQSVSQYDVACLNQFLHGK